MSTNFYSQSTQEWAFVTYYGGTPGTGNRSDGEPRNGPCVDFGVNMTNAFNVVEAMRAGEVFWGEDGRPFTEEDVMCRNWTFGAFSGTFEVGSGDIMRWEGFV